jgi:hypothetical protein
MTDTIQHRRGTAARWTAANPVLRAGEIGVETDTVKLKVGDGETAWNSLPYCAGLQGQKGDKGDKGDDADISDITDLQARADALETHAQLVDNELSTKQDALDGLLQAPEGVDLQLKPVNSDNPQADLMWRIAALSDGQKFAGTLIAPADAAGCGYIADLSALVEPGYGPNDYAIYQHAGEMIVQDQTTGYVYKFLLGGGKVQLMGTTNPNNWTAPVAPSTSVTISDWVSMTATQGGYRFTSLASPARNFVITGTKTRKEY